MRNALYLDTSAIVKLVLDEAESSALLAVIAETEHLVSSVVGEIETRRVVARVPDTEGILSSVMEQVLARMSVVPLSGYLVASAGALAPPELRTLDAIHLATALAITEELRGIAVYDHRLASAAAARGLAIVAPEAG